MRFARVSKTFNILFGLSIWLLLTMVYLGFYLQKLPFRTVFFLNIGILFTACLILCVTRSGPFWPRRLIENKTQFIVFLLILTLGIFFRTWQFGTFPPQNGQHLEEAQSGGVASNSLQTHSIYPYFPLADLTAQAGLLWFGNSMTGIRIPFVISSLFSVLFFFLASRLLLRSFYAAGIASILFACSAFLAGSSRIALETMSPMTTLTLAIAGAMYAVSRRDTTSIAIAGLTSGLLLLEYFSYKPIAVYLAIFIIVSLMQNRTEPYCEEKPLPFEWSQLFKKAAPFVLIVCFCLAVSMPLIAFDRDRPFSLLYEGLWRHSQTMESQARTESISELIWNQISNVDRTWRFVFTESPAQNDVLPDSMGLIEFFTGVAGAVAFGYCLVTCRRRPTRMMLVGSILLTVVLGGVLVTNPSRYRLIPLIPFFFLMIGVALDDMFELVKRRRGLLIWRTALIVFVAVGLNGYNFFMIAIRHPQVLASFHDTNVELGLEIAAIQKEHPEDQVLLISNRNFLDTRNDYSFLYDIERLSVSETIPPDHGIPTLALAHDQFVEVLAAHPGKTDCQEFRGTRNRYMKCRID